MQSSRVNSKKRSRLTRAHDGARRERDVHKYRSLFLREGSCRVAEKAYDLYERRGCCHGQDVDDWLEAERIILAEIELQQTRGDKKRKEAQNM